MALRAMLGLIIPALFSASILADTLKINPSHPDRYTVVKGDTLWDISGKFLQHPWQWPELWRNNPQIKNPHWIYPGDTLYFSYVNGEPQLSFAPGADSGLEPNLTPHIRESDIKQAIPMIPSDAIAQFLSSPKVMDAEEIANAPYVLEIADEHLVAGAGDRIYVRSIEHPEGLTYTVFREGKPYISPETKEILGYEAQYVADTVIEAPGDPATLRVMKSDGEVRRGDRLMLSSEEGELALNYFPRPPEQILVGSILRVMGGVTQIGQHDIVVIDKGTADGLEVGHTLDVYKKGKIVVDKHQSDAPEQVKLPDELAGQILVFRPFERVSYALVMKATSAIHVLDRVQTP